MFLIIILLIIFYLLYIEPSKKCRDCVVNLKSNNITGGGNIKDFKLYVKNCNGFKKEVEEICKNNKWNELIKKHNKTLTLVEKDANITIDFADRNIIGNIFGKKDYYDSGVLSRYNKKTKEEIYFSVTVNDSTRYTLIDEINWNIGVLYSGMNLKQYRRYVILHELGHLLGYGHVPFSSNKFNMMYQWTRGINTEQDKLRKYTFDNIEPSEDDITKPIW